MHGKNAHPPYSEPTQSFAGKVLVAMPGMKDPQFKESVIYVCGHDCYGAMGLVINRVAENISFGSLMSQLQLPYIHSQAAMPVYIGGPVEMGRGFVLHTSDFIVEATVMVQDKLAITSSVDILRDIAAGHGPRKQMLCLGYAGWEPGQLENEIKNNGWLFVEPNEDLIFKGHEDHKWNDAMRLMGVESAILMSQPGNA